MKSSQSHQPGLWQGVTQLKEICDRIHARLLFFVAASALSLAAAFFETATLGVLIPLAKGILQRDFHFVHEFPILKNIVEFFPPAWKASNQSVFLFLIFTILCTAILKNLFQYVSISSVEKQVARITSGMRKMVFERFLSFGKLYFDRTSMGHMNQMLMGFTATITRKLQDLNVVVHLVFLSAAYLVMLFAISWKLTLLSLLIFPLLYYSLEWLVVKIRKTALYESEAKLALNKKISNILMCLPLVKAYTREPEEQRQFNRLSDLEAGIQFNIAKKRELVNPIQEIVSLGATLAMVSIMALILIKDKSANVAALLVYFVILRRLIMSFSSLNGLRATFASIVDPVARIYALLDNCDKCIVAEGNKKFPGLKDRIEFHRLNFSYVKDLPILQDVSFTIPKGKITALVGPTGAGKSTIIHLLMRFYDCAPGAILIDGTDIREFDFASLRSHMAIVSQDTLLFNDTIRANITYGLDRSPPQNVADVKDADLIEVSRKAQLYDFIMSLPNQFDTLVGDRGILLSGGERQRLSIARAMLKGAEILLLDEATSALDSETERKIQQAIDEALKGRTALVIAHRLSTIRKADHILVLDHGRLAEQGSLDDLLTRKGKFYSYWREQSDFLDPVSKKRSNEQ